MIFSVESGSLMQKKAGAKAVCFFEHEAEQKKGFEASYGKLAAKAIESKEFTAKACEVFVLHELEDKLFLLGLGKEKELNKLDLSKAFGTLLTALKKCKCTEIAIEIPAIKSLDSEAIAKTLVEAFVLADYKFTDYKKPKNEATEVSKVTLVTYDHVESVKKQVSYAASLGQATNYVRAINNQPANIASTTYMVEQARKLAKEKGLKISVLEKKDLQKLGLNALLAVGAGSEHSPKLVVLEYGDSSKKPVAIVGKGVVFDSGGISIKPSNDMDKMKFDKSGACAVLGIMKAASELHLPLHVIGVMPLAENLPSGSAYRPGDIVRAYNGKTIEVLNTDAEGRMILADALAYAVDKYKPSAVIDLATLTGACVVALGDVASGLMANNTQLAEKIKAAGLEANEWVWELPMWKEYREKIDCENADIKNIGSPGEAGTIAGGMFLKEFVGDTPWAHLDIAGTAWNTKPKQYMATGATGVGVRLIIEYLKKA